MPRSLSIKGGGGGDDADFEQLIAELADRWIGELYHSFR